MFIMLLQVIFRISRPRLIDYVWYLTVNVLHLDKYFVTDIL